ncbi:MAG: hypothetical protein J1G30_00795 [Spirochaetales bacterium]|nr:hypothetical protein [Spirochaetales bacterium]
MDLSNLTNKAAAVIISDKKTAIFQRKDGKWEFPNAALKDDEKVDNAIINLSKDNLGIDVIPAAEIGSIEQNIGNGIEIAMFIHVNTENPAGITLHSDYSAFKYVTFEELGGLDLADDEKKFLETCADDLKKHITD